ncbi:MULTISPECIES: DoxX family protein [unclassified Arcicella]|uniref:DoxX family protein n=1 Tax=unclassified Arcicella TaxID=2644986 RepID=UPI00285E53A2|nr:MULTISPECIES: DoxX family protein [unclassified Arcicella]MDR6561375.1 putative membrane protein YphA (DoxX/SURF4 family) [Arcicella sp. BE51]MDR6811259.1 putative membrane protein YphA (DoxX/SURF4 family) [Arcicella sp. BE140]MDR6822609.1 putative membrane protein YphA (DoxX/SURF4 family) [Arcicella sp. BE139]
MTSQKKYISWTAQIIAAVILFQTLFFKFSGATESVHLFTKLGVEPFGRYGAGITELITVVLLLTPRKAWLGAFLGIGVMSGAILAHLTVLGIESDGDGGYLFILALITLLCCSVVAYIRKGDFFAFFYTLI